MSNAGFVHTFSPLLLAFFLSHAGTRGPRRNLRQRGLSVFERDAYTLAAQSQFYTLLLGREIDDHPMLVAHGLGFGPTPHRHIVICALKGGSMQRSACGSRDIPGHTRGRALSLIQP